MKEVILDKSAEMFLTLGFKSVTMDDIANELSISKKTIYANFKNKTELIQCVTLSVFDKICDGIDSICENSKNPIEELYSVKIFVMDYLKGEETSPQYQLKKYYPKIYNNITIKHFKKMNGSVIESLQKGIETKIFRENLDVEFISRMYFNGILGIKDEEVFPRTNFKPKYLMDSFLEYHLRAISTEKGLEILNTFIKNNQ